MALAAASISQQETERKAVELLDEFYRLFFKDTPVSLAGQTVTLPLCDYQFGVMAPPQPAQRPAIHTVFSDWKIRSSHEAGGRRVFADVQLQIYVRVGSQSGTALVADALARSVADSVMQLFQSEKHVLAQKGIRRSNVVTGPSPLPFAGMSARMLLVKAQFQYIAAI